MPCNENAASLASHLLQHHILHDASFSPCLRSLSVRQQGSDLAAQCVELPWSPLRSLNGRIAATGSHICVLAKPPRYSEAAYCRQMTGRNRHRPFDVLGHVPLPSAWTGNFRSYRGLDLSLQPRSILRARQCELYDAAPASYRRNPKFAQAVELHLAAGDQCRRKAANTNIGHDLKFQYLALRQ